VLLQLLHNAFTTYGKLRSSKGNYADAVTLYEEAYDCVAIAYNPVYPIVQMVSIQLIECLLHKGDLDKAELYAQMTLDSLKDPGNGVDQDSKEVADGYHCLANVICQQKGDQIKAERLAREAYRIQLHLHDHSQVGHCANLLANILMEQENLADETRGLYECYLACAISNDGLDGSDTATGNANLGRLYLSLSFKQLTVDKIVQHLNLAMSYAKEASRISMKISSSSHPSAIEHAKLMLAITGCLSCAQDGI
jgi:tetratricopeptide (TPR) repeat protein